jgi:hypothetical protein
MRRLRTAHKEGYGIFPRFSHHRTLVEPQASEGAVDGTPPNSSIIRPCTKNVVPTPRPGNPPFQSVGALQWEVFCLDNEAELHECGHAIVKADFFDDLAVSEFENRRSGEVYLSSCCGR